ncbi:MAG TPA: FAD-dependent oxidoreductase [Micromonosporaceae bacterium]|nr:FAD-dependent oxidoreductase [Micromonosporaceae bacterium]
MSTQQTILIVGASLAGAKAAEALRAQGFDGRLVLIGEEPERPYERPPLSKAHLSGAPKDVHVHDETFYARHSIELRTSTTVTELNPAEHTVTLADTTRIRYDKALLTTGATPRRLTVPGADLDGVHYLRTLADADRLLAAAARARAVAVIGAGWIGTEVTASLRQRGLPVTLIDPASTPLERVLGRDAGTVFRDLHAAHGVALHLGDGVRSLHGAGRVAEVRTTGGTAVPADLVVVGIGAVPRVELAAAAGLAVDNGIVVDEHLRTSHPDVYAAGDVARAWHPGYREHIRVEHWSNAINQGAAAAANMLGTAAAYADIPYFFSDQYDLGMEYTGYSPHFDRVVFRGDPHGGEFIAFWLTGGRVTGGMNVNIWDVNEYLQQLARRHARVDPDRLADPRVPLETLVSEAANL